MLGDRLTVTEVNVYKLDTQHNYSKQQQQHKIYSKGNERKREVEEKLIIVR